jgi:thiopeptide-type bacteriocin biosynthesis protein
MAAMATWNSVFIYGPDDLYGASYDWLLAKIVSPVFDSRSMRGREWFCVRYLDDAPHLRCRWKGDADALQVRECLSRAVASPGAWRKRFEVRDGFYEPEVERYGGLHAMRDAESLFFRSSQMAARSMEPHESFSAPRRAGQAILGMILLWSAASGENVAWQSLAKEYLLRLREMGGEHAENLPDVLSRTDIQLVRSIVDATRTPRSLPLPARRMFSAAQRFAEALRRSVDGEVVGRHRRFEGGIGSQVHLHCNRLGVSPRGELHLSTIVVQAMQQLSLG